MREGWEIKTLGEVCDISAGQGAPQGEDNYCLDGTPFIKAGNLEALVNGEGEQSVQKVSKEVALSHHLVLQKKGSIVFAKSGMSCMKGYVYTLQQDCYVVSHLAILFPKSVSGPYLNYALHFFKPSSLAKDASFPSITLKDLAIFPIPFPTSLQEQQRIVDILDREFAKIDALKANAEKSLQAAKDLFQATLKKELEPREGWTQETLSAVSAEMFAGGDAPKNQMADTPSKEYPIPIIANAVENDGLYGYTSIARVSVPSITIAGRGSGTGYVFRRRYSYFPIVRLIVIIPNDNIICLDYLYFAIKSLNIQSSGSAIPQLTIPMIKNYLIAYPAKCVQEVIVKRLTQVEEGYFQLQDNYQKTISLCDDLKQALLHKAFNGEL